MNIEEIILQEIINYQTGFNKNHALEDLHQILGMIKISVKLGLANEEFIDKYTEMACYVYFKKM